METVWCFGETHCLHFQGMKISSSEYWITTFSGNPVILYHWTLSHFPVTRSSSVYVRCSLRKNKVHPVKTTLASHSDCDVVLTADLSVGFSQNLIWHFFIKFVEHVWVSWKSVQGKSYSIFRERFWWHSPQETSTRCCEWGVSFMEITSVKVTVTEREYTVEQMLTKYKRER
jgi:hypothetical protein